MLKVPLDGRFLVRKSTKEPDTYVLGLTFSDRIYHHKVRGCLWWGCCPQWALVCLFV